LDGSGAHLVRNQFTVKKTPFGIVLQKQAPLAKEHNCATKKI